MEQLAKFGPNKTGVSVALERAREMQEGTGGIIAPPIDVLPDLAADVVAQAAEGEPLGHVPMPVREIDGEALMELFIDKVGDRMAFERTGVRLYEGILAKFQAYGSWEGGPEWDDLERIREEELVHFHALVEIMIQIGGDPSAVTPSADVAGQLASGVCAVVNDPRTTLVQSLEAMLVAELTDVDCWDTLIELARALGRENLAEVLAPFGREEEGHLEQVRRWLAAAQMRDVSAVAH
jgi:hypothetical protein